MNRLLRFLPEGPSAKQLEQGSTYIMASASKQSAEKSVWLKGPEVYLFTALYPREITAKILHDAPAPGFQTPAFYGKALLDGVDQVAWAKRPEGFSGRLATW